MPAEPAPTGEQTSALPNTTTIQMETTHSSEDRHPRRKRSQKDANIGEPSPGNNPPTPKTPGPTTERGKKRKANFETPPPPNSPLIEESFHPEMASPTPPNVPAPPLFRDDLDLDATTSEPNTSFSLDTTHQSNVVSSLKERIIAAKERGTKVNTNNAESKDPIDKYTKYSKSEKENIYYSHPTAALDHIDVDQVGDWESLPDGKLLAHPFGHEVRSIESHQGIKASLFAAVVEITQSDTVGICSPRPCSPSLGTPTVFLIYNISELHRQMLLKREVWSSTAFTFRVTTLDPVSPDYLFAITNLTTKSKPEVKEVVRKVWDSESTIDFLESIIDTYPDEKQATVMKNLADFSKSMWIDMLDTKKPGGAAAPTFNVYAKGNFINDDGLWCTLRNFLATQTYALQFQDPGMAGTDLHHCSICHSIEHPRGLCPFPAVTGWNGPFWDIPDPKRGGENWRRKLTSAKRGNAPNY